MNYEIILWVLLGVLADFIFAFIGNKKKLRLKTKRFMIHHSVYGLLLMVLGLIFFQESFIGFGFGIVVGHTARLKKLVFIEKIRKR